MAVGDPAGCWIWPAPIQKEISVPSAHPGAPIMGHSTWQGNRDVEPNLGSSLATSLNTAQGKSYLGAQSVVWEQISTFSRLCWEGMSIAHPLCFGTWQGTRSSPCTRNCWPWGKPAPLLLHKGSPLALTPAYSSLPQPSMAKATAELCALLLLLAVLCCRIPAQSERSEDTGLLCAWATGGSP